MEFIIEGLILLASIVGVAVIIERGIALRSRRIIPPEVEGAVENCRAPEDLPMLRRTCGQHPSPLSRLLLLADERRDWPKTENANGLETLARHEVSKMERRLVILEIVVGIAPLMGLVGTIYGMIELFGDLGAHGLGDNSKLATGIGLALYATLMGLLTAIPSLVAWSYYSKKVENLAVEMAALCDTFLTRQYNLRNAAETDEIPATRRP